MVLADTDLTARDWRAPYEASATAADLERFVEHVRLDYLPHTVLVDCTASAEVAAHYADWLAAGIHIVTPNKKANSGPLAGYQQPADGTARGRLALPLRGDGRRRAAGGAARCAT